MFVDKEGGIKLIDLDQYFETKNLCNSALLPGSHKHAQHGVNMNPVVMMDYRCLQGRERAWLHPQRLLWGKPVHASRGTVYWPYLLSPHPPCATYGPLGLKP